MATKLPYKTTFEVDNVIQPIFTGVSVALDNNARFLATTLGEDAVLTNLETGKVLTKIEGDGEPISALALPPTASRLIVCSRSLSLRVYALKISPNNSSIETTLERTLKPHSTPAVVLAVDRTGTLLAIGAADGNIKVLNIQGGFYTHNFRGPNVPVSALCFFETASGGTNEVANHQGTISKARKHSDAASKKTDSPPTLRLTSGSQDGTVIVWDLYSKRTVISKLESHVSDVQGLDYSSAQQCLVTASRDKTIIWWDARSWKARKVVPSFDAVEAAGFVDDGRLTYSAGANGCVRFWETDSGREVTREQPPRSEEEAIVRAIYRQGQSMLLCTQMDHTLALYRTPSILASEPISEISPLQPLRRISGTHDDIIDLGYLLPDQSLIALATNSEDIRIVSAVDSPAGQTGDGEVASYFGQDIALLKGHEDIIITLDIDWSGHWVATGAKDNTARLWRVDPAHDSYECYAVFAGHAESLGAAALPKTVPPESSPAYCDPLNHPPAFLITGSQDQTVKRWDIPRQAQDDSKKGLRALFTRKAHEKDINAIDVGRAGQLFASASQDRTVKIWSTQEGEVQGILKGHKRGVWSVRFSPPNTPAIQGEDSPVAGKGVILTGSGDKTVKIWSLFNYTCLRTFEGHSNSVLKVAWLKMPSEDDKQKRIQFATAGGDGLVKVWDANSGETECTLDNHEDRVWALAVHPRTNMIVSGSGDSTVSFWKDTSSATQAAASEAAMKLIEQEQELENHIHTGSYRDAITLALQLNHPGRLLGLFNAVVSSATPEEGSLCGLRAVDEVLANLSDEQIFLLLLRLRDWNTNARTAPVAQRILWTVVRSYPATKFSNLSVKGAQGQRSLKEVLNALKVYTERHYRRMEELVDESYLVEYTLGEMDALAPLAGAGTDGDIVMVE